MNNNEVTELEINNSSVKEMTLLEIINKFGISEEAAKILIDTAESLIQLSNFKKKK
jgi:hypothetical protein